MIPFTYKRATNLADATGSFAATSSSAYLAGGTTMIDLMKLDVITPKALIDINRLDLTSIEQKDNSVFVGALVTNSEMAHHPLIEQNFPFVSKALLSGASVQLRNMATVGGNIMQRTRCYYYRDTATPCNKREPGSGCPAIEGLNRMHAILGGSDHCIAVFPSDMCVALVAADAIVHVNGPKGARSIPMQDFHMLPGDHPEHETCLAPGELIEKVEIPLHGRNKRSYYLKVRDRASYAFALVSAAVALELEGDTIKSARVALGGVATKPWRSPEAEAALVGKPANKETYAAAGRAAVKDAKGYKHNSFKIELSKRVIVRALEKAMVNA